MSDFPTLKTGAMLQYPAQKTTQFFTSVLRFVDGSEQRFRDSEVPLRRWTISLDLLDESEIQILREFFRTQAGAAGTFAFTDPRDGVRYPDCSFEKDDLTDQLVSQSGGKTTLTVRQMRT